MGEDSQQDEALIVFLFGGSVPDGVDVKECLEACGDSEEQFDCLLKQCENCKYNPLKNQSSGKKKCLLWKRLKIAKTLSELPTPAVPIIFELVLFRTEAEQKYKPVDVFIDVLEDLEIESVKENALIIVFPESIGSITEFVHYTSDKNMRKIVRAIVDTKYNPYYQEKLSFLSAYYLRFAGETGHLYVADTSNISELELIVKRIVQAEIKNRIVQKSLNISKNNNNIRGEQK